MGGAASSKLNVWYARHVPQAERVAFLMTGDTARAGLIARRGWATALGTFQDLRAGDELQIHILRAAVRARGRHRVEAGVEVALWRALLAGPRRPRAAAILVWHEELAQARTAEILDCSEVTLTHLLAAARAIAERALGRRVTDAEITSALRRSAASLRSPIAPSSGLLGRVRAGRRVVAAAAGLGLVVTLALGVEVTRVLLSPGARAAVLARDEATPTTFGRPSAGLGRPDRYRLGFSGFCPSEARRPPAVRVARRQAGAVALRFNRALAADDSVAAAALVANPQLARGVEWAHTATGRELEITFSAPPSARDLDAFDCDPDIMRRTWRIVMHDATGTTSLGIAVFYLARTDLGWRVWASYEPAI